MCNRAWSTSIQSPKYMMYMGIRRYSVCKEYRHDFSITDHGAQLFIVPGICCRVSKKYRLSSRHRRVIVCIGGPVSSANDYS